MTANSSLGTAEVFDPRRCRLGEGPVWHPESGRWLWVDILGHTVCWKRPGDGASGELTMPADIGAVLPGKGGVLWAFLVEGVYRIDKEGVSPWKVAHFPHSLEPVQGTALMRANDAAVTPHGDILCGTMPYDPDKYPGSAALYRFDGATVTPIVEGVTISNGLGWSADSTLMFYVDTPTQRVDVFDYDPQQGPHNRRVFSTIPDTAGSPDGLALDSDDNVWVALWGGSRVQRLGKDGQPNGYLELPCENITSCAFGGDDLRELIVTTAALEHEDVEAAGMTYSFRAPVPGLATREASV